MGQPPTASLALALPCLDASGPKVDAIREILTGVQSVPLDDANVFLRWHEDTLRLEDLRRKKLLPLSVEWLEPLQKLRSWPAARQGPLAQAVGRRTETIIDATAGWGQDALRLMMMGYSMQLMERCRVMAALLVDGKRRCFAADLRHARAVPPPVIVESACEALPQLQADCVYLDPMFPPKRNISALAKRPLELLRELAGNDDDREALFDAACLAARRRVVVKRPDHAAPLRADPQHSFSGKLVRFDVYLMG